jgi:FkbM family methyltransferase
MNDFLATINDKLKGQEPKVILDIGSRDLEHALKFRAAYPKARILAFEPNPLGISKCVRNVGNSGIEFFELALSDEEGKLSFWSVELNDGCSSLLEPIDAPFSNNRWHHIRVDTRRLDNLLEELGINKVDVLWMDTQGTELKVLQGMGKYLDDVQCIHTEASPRGYYKGHILKDELEEFLHANGFETTFRTAKGHPYGEGDIICVRKNENY